MARLDLSVSCRVDRCIIPSGISYSSFEFGTNSLAVELSGSSLDYNHGDADDFRAFDVGPGQLIAYSNDIGAATPDDTVMTYLRPPFIIPSQTLRDDDSHGETMTDHSLVGSPRTARKPLVASYYDIEKPVVPVATKSDAIASSEIVRTRSVHKRYRVHHHMTSAKSGQQSTEERIPFRILKEAKATRLKKYKCNLCHKGFDRQEHYKRHQLSETHRNLMKECEKEVLEPLVKSYPCKKCGKTFNRHDNLKPHIKTHLSIAGKNSRNDPVTIAESWEFGWEELDPRITPEELARGRRERARRVAGDERLMSM